MPGVLAAIVGAVTAAFATEEIYGLRYETDPNLFKNLI